ncbi:DUF421 domain-containing protein [Paenibacillus turpanensis]|uniref:DUF421 domain-containing protein n=1 Tax=Paenibacillus turpanensis TaxID=2689078 RepID=UPI00140A23A3|nr:DUF421 domain-containing protein [Paenibacillus turpanensis]
MDILKDLAVVLGRIVTIFPVMLIITLFMGRRSIGEMPVFDFLVILSLGSVVGADIADPNIQHLPTAFAIIVIGIVQKIFSHSAIKSRWFGKLVTFEPIIVIYNGKFIYQNVKNINYSIDNLLQMLREKNIFDVQHVHLGVIEGSGKLTIMELANTSASYPIIREGKIEKNVLSKFGVHDMWLKDQMKQQQVQLEDIFLATINEQHALHIMKYEDKEPSPLPPLYH